MNSFSRSYNLFKSTLSVLEAEKSLAAYPVLAALTMVLTTLFVLALCYAILAVNPEIAQYLENAAQTDHQDAALPSWMLGSVFAGLYFYLFLMYVIIYFFMTGLAGAALMRLEGKDPTLGDGLRISSDRIGVIIGFSLIAATIGLLLSLLRNRNNTSGRILAMFGGIAWNVASFLVIPVIAARKVGPIDALKESATLLKKSWGEQLIGSAGLGLIFGLMMVGVLLGTGGLINVVTELNSPQLLFILIGLGAILLATLAILSSTLNAIYRVAVFRYAATGEIAGPFQKDLIAGAFHRKT